MLGEVDGHKTREIEKQFLDAFGESAVADSTFLDGIQFKQEQTICCPETFAAERVVGRKEIAADDAH